LSKERGFDQFNRFLGLFSVSVFILFFSLDVNTLFSEWISLEGPQHFPLDKKLHFQSEIIVVGKSAASLGHVGRRALGPAGRGNHFSWGSPGRNSGRARPVLLGVGCVPLGLPGVVELTLVGVRLRLGVATAAAGVGLTLKQSENNFVSLKIISDDLSSSVMLTLSSTNMSQLNKLISFHTKFLKIVFYVPEKS
jgi:hypothetical protein